MIRCFAVTVSIFFVLIIMFNKIVYMILQTKLSPLLKNRAQLLYRVLFVLIGFSEIEVALVNALEDKHR